MSSLHRSIIEAFRILLAVAPYDVPGLPELKNQDSIGEALVVLAKAVHGRVKTLEMVVGVLSAKEGAGHG